jgi:hypothetical protein
MFCSVVTVLALLAVATRAEPTLLGDHSAPPIETRHSDVTTKRPMSIQEAFPKPAIQLFKTYHSAQTKPLLHSGVSGEDQSCHYEITPDSRWTKDTIEVAYDLQNSGLDPVLVKQAMQQAYRVWKEAAPSVPKLVLRERRVDENGIRDEVNQISFSAIRSTNAINPLIIETYVWKDSTQSMTIVEADVIFDTRVAWFIPGSQPNDPNLWIRTDASAYNFLNQLVGQFGHMLGLGGSNAHSHSMFRISDKGEHHKLSLECGDRKGIRALYP